MSKFIGDVHGKFDAYEKLIRENDNTIQVGDMGVGFRSWPHGEWRANPPHDKMVASNSLFIRGNHDNPHVCRRHSQCIQDGHFTKLDGRTTMFIGGGLSIDKDYRIEDFSWWPEEQLSQPEMNRIADIYEKVKPEIMVTHECPITATVNIPHSHHFDDHSRTSQFLQSLWNYHKPKIWVHGHHHVSVDHVIEGTRFICLAELEMKDI
jgi:Icc-related predicted phosphoesterase